MNPHSLLLGIGLLALGVGLGVGGTLLLPRPSNGLADDMHADDPPQAEEEQQADTLTLAAGAIADAGIATTALPAATHRAETPALGRLELDPATTVILRAPAAGTLQRTAERAWPAIGTKVAKGDVLGLLVPRLTPVERADLQQRAVAAGLEIASATAASAAAEANLRRTRDLNADDKNVSDRELEDASSRATIEAARLTMARRTQDQLTTLLTEPAMAPLICPGTGEVVELTSSPGETAAADQPLLRVADTRQLLARILPPLGQPFDSAATNARITLPGAPPIGCIGKLVGHGLDDSLLFELEASTADMRPGLPVTAWLPNGPIVDGMIVPGDAVVRMHGRSLVFVRLPDAADAATARFRWHAIPTDNPTEAGFFVPVAAGRPGASGLAVGDPVVSSGAAVLLSQLMRHEIPATDEEPAEGK